MDYLMNAFKNSIRQYGYRFILARRQNTYVLDFFNLPPELDYKLLLLKLQINKEVILPYNDKSTDERTTIETTFEPVCQPIVDKKFGKVIHVEFTPENYAAKINKIEICLRNFCINKKKKDL